MARSLVPVKTERCHIEHCSYGSWIGKIIRTHVSARANPTNDICRTNGIATLHIGGYCNPFDLSNVVLGLCAIMIRGFWTENYGEMAQKANQDMLELSWWTHPFEPFVTVLSNVDMLCCGLVCSLFEAKKLCHDFTTC